MAAKVEKTLSPPTGSPWYGKIFECWRNRNQVSPGTVELPDCDFLFVAPRRTLRVLRPALKGGWYYETTTADLPESINDNFFSRWARRPHPSGNCRCSFRQSVGALSTTEERIISAELNRIRTSLCETEGNARDLDELQRRVSANLEKLRDRASNNRTSETPRAVDSMLTADRRSFELTAKQQIVKDLERYINTLLEEMLDDTVKHVAGIEKNNVQHSSEITWKRVKNGLRTNHSAEDPDKSKDALSIRRVDDGSSLIAINPPFPTDQTQEQWSAENECEKPFARISIGEGYVNPAFVGSTDELSSLRFNRCTEKQSNMYLGMSANTESMPPEQLDCVDSGINSVETIEFQPPDQEPSFEQSLLRIIDEKLGRGFSLDPSRENSTEKTWQEAIPAEEMDHTKTVHVSSDCKASTSDARQVEQSEINADVDFENSRLEFQNNDANLSLNGETLSALDTCKIATESMGTPPIELKDYKREWTERDEIEPQDNVRRSLRNSLTSRKNRKPTIVFLHGFGSSAEVFEHQLQYFSSLGYPCIAPDMLGHGMSSAPGRSRDYHFGKLLKDLDAILHHYAFRSGEKCVLVAHNYGCSFATALAYKYDSNIYQLVLISGGGPTPLAPPSAETASRCCLRAVLTPLLMCGLHRDVLYSARGRQHPYCGEESMEQWPSHMKHVLDGMIWPEGDYVFHRRICTPTLLVHGLRDNKVSLMQECHMERTMMKAFLEAIPMAGHTPMTECPQQLNHMIHCFIDLWKNKKWKQ